MTYATHADALAPSAVPSLAERENTAGDRMATILGWCMGLGLIAAMWAVCAYVYTFGWRVSKDHDIWNQADGFFGGVLGPTFGFLSLMALLLTVMLQREQLSLSRAQLAESGAELERSRELQLVANQAMTQQAHYAAISARAVALGAALEVVGRQLKDQQFSSGLGLATRTGSGFDALYREHERMTAELLDVTRNLVARSAI